MSEENFESVILKKTLLKNIYRIVLLPLMGMALILVFVPLVKPFPIVYDSIVLAVKMMAELIVDVALFAAFYQFGLICLDLFEWFSDNTSIIIEMIQEHKEKTE